MIEIEDLLSQHTLHQLNDPLKFKCTQCGECCRSSDHIMLSPLDLFHMSRAPALRDAYGIDSTAALIAHPAFKPAFHFIVKDGYPVCYLRPILSSLRRCHFSYTLLMTPTDLPSTDLAAAGAGTGAAADTPFDLNPLPTPPIYSAILPRPPSPANLPQPEPQSTRAYRVLSALESLAVAGGGAGGAAGASSDPQIPTASRISESAADCGQSPPPSPVPLVNGYGNGALGCLLGVENMPTMCASYPVSPELSVADFWHVRRSFWLNKDPDVKRAGVSAKSSSRSAHISQASSGGIRSDTSSDGSRSGSSSKIATGWQTEEE